ncbi:hypothetical protein HPB51_023648 [Rhipicephalus microplus]|uniref:Uncharacterized protein n=1 Tax=Rhipicephalus microplus TaxID=6941 RepID=A0A9J6EK37_RHIMP|nr:hypothetical protein HPB51_023648 [Rhipicephalus microplus]
MIREDRRIPPFVVGIFAGPGKPASAKEFLNKLVSDLQQLLSQGMIFHGHLIDVSLKCFVLDAPARSFVFQIKGHTGYSGCPKCTAEACDGIEPCAFHDVNLSYTFFWHFPFHVCFCIFATVIFVACSAVLYWNGVLHHTGFCQFLT